MFKFFIMPDYPGSLKINVHYEHQETGFFLFSSLKVVKNKWIFISEAHGNIASW